MPTPPGVPRWGAAYRDFLAQYYTRHTVIAAQVEDLPYAHQTIDLKPLLSCSFPLGQLEEAFAAAARPDTYRVFVTPDGV